MKFKIISILILSLLLVNTSTAFAEEIYSSPTAEGTTISPKIEITEYRYKYINGIKYKRLWSVTRNCWIDPAWTPA